MARRRRRRGEGSVYQSQGSWIACYPLGTVNGKRKTARSRHKSEYDALAELDRLHRIHGAGGDPSRITLGEYLADWHDGHRHSVRPRTAITQEGHIRNYITPLLGGIPVARLRPADVRRLIAHLDRQGLAPATIHRVVSTLRVALRRLVRERSLPDNPADVELPRVELQPVQPVGYVTADAIRQAVAGHWTEHIVRLLLGSGLRLGEAIGLDQGDVLLDQRFVRVRKSKTTIRAVPISSDAADALREAMALAPRRGASEPVFFAPLKRHERMVGTSVSHVLPGLLAAHRLPALSPHKLRHAAATIMLEAGHPMRVIAEQLGHRNPALTARYYAHVVPEQQRSAVDALDRRPEAVSGR